ncbi:hypothetical protein EK21DRAFT_85272 [Setomelanomma holmii]|uniref:Uncharacterized protein n=1 Tax=Setomelanomma holmii TaxID=210430 RepID=A0A9P4HGR7_9PLEO|nr:hypothetical protein EK21DRAFT_85272 [Setomelanomma holmii]
MACTNEMRSGITVPSALPEWVCAEQPPAGRREWQRDGDGGDAGRQQSCAEAARCSVSFDEDTTRHRGVHTTAATEAVSRCNTVPFAIQPVPARRACTPIRPIDNGDSCPRAGSPVPGPLLTLNGCFEIFCAPYTARRFAVCDMTTLRPQSHEPALTIRCHCELSQEAAHRGHTGHDLDAPWPGGSDFSAALKPDRIALHTLLHVAMVAIILGGFSSTPVGGMRAKMATNRTTAALLERVSGCLG